MLLEALKHHWVSRVCTWVPLGAWHKLCGITLVVPLWHIVSDFELPHVSARYRFRNIRQFQADLEYLLRHFSPVTEQDVICHLHDGGPLPPRCVLLTFDDGFREIHDVVAPLLRAKGVPAIFFLTSSALDNLYLCDPQKKSLLVSALARHQSAATLRKAASLASFGGVPINGTLAAHIDTISYRQRHVLDDLGRVLECDFQGYLTSQRPYLTSQQVESLVRQGFAIGAHSVDHPLYAELSLDEQLFQTRESMHWLSRRFQIDCRSFAFPYRDNGVSLAFFRTMFTEGQLKVSFGTEGLIPHSFPYNLPRFSTEHTGLTAAQVLSSQYGRTLVRWRMGFS